MTTSKADASRAAELDKFARGGHEEARMSRDVSLAAAASSAALAGRLCCLHIASEDLHVFECRHEGRSEGVRFEVGHVLTAHWQDYITHWQWWVTCRCISAGIRNGQRCVLCDTAAVSAIKG